MCVCVYECRGKEVVNECVRMHVCACACSVCECACVCVCVCACVRVCVLCAGTLVYAYMCVFV